MTDQETIRIYDSRAEDYARVTDSDSPDAKLAAFLAALPDGARVLDFGCGPGRSAAYMAAAGHKVDAWDASEGMVALAARHPGVSARLAGFDALKAEAVYDAVWANFSLLHASRDEIPRHLKAIRRALKPGGIFHIAVKEGEGSKRDTLGRLYTYFTEPELAGMLTAAGLTPGSFRRGEGKGLDNIIAPWISVTAHA